VDIGEAITFGGVYVSAMIAIWVWVGLTCEVKVATEPAGFWSVVWVGELDMPDRLQAEITVTSKRNIDRRLKIFNFAFTIAMKIYSRQFVFVTLIIYKTLPRRIHRPGGVCLRHLGDIYPTLPGTARHRSCREHDGARRQGKCAPHCVGCSAGERSGVVDIFS